MYGRPALNCRHTHDGRAVHIRVRADSHWIRKGMQVIRALGVQGEKTLNLASHRASHVATGVLAILGTVRPTTRCRTQLLRTRKRQGHQIVFSLVGRLARTVGNS